jgi:hypothetical protein
MQTSAAVRQKCADDRADDRWADGVTKKLDLVSPMRSPKTAHSKAYDGPKPGSRPSFGPSPISGSGAA